MTLRMNIQKLALSLVVLALIISLSSCSRQLTQEGSVKSSTVQKEEPTRKNVTAIDPANSAEPIGEEQVCQYLYEMVPEIHDFEQDMVRCNQESNTDYKMIMRIDSKPDPQAGDVMERDFYYIYVGSDMGDHTSCWNRFYVKKDLFAVMAEDIISGTPMTIDEWRDVSL